MLRLFLETHAMQKKKREQEFQKAEFLKCAGGCQKQGAAAPPQDAETVIFNT